MKFLFAALLFLNISARVQSSESSEFRFAYTISEFGAGVYSPERNFTMPVTPHHMEYSDNENILLAAWSKALVLDKYGKMISAFDIFGAGTFEGQRVTRMQETRSGYILHGIYPEKVIMIDHRDRNRTILLKAPRVDWEGMAFGKYGYSKYKYDRDQKGFPFFDIYTETTRYELEDIGNEIIDIGCKNNKMHVLYKFQPNRKSKTMYKVRTYGSSFELINEFDVTNIFEAIKASKKKTRRKNIYLFPLKQDNLALMIEKVGELLYVDKKGRLISKAKLPDIKSGYRPMLSADGKTLYINENQGIQVFQNIISSEINSQSTEALLEKAKSFFNKGNPVRSLVLLNSINAQETNKEKVLKLKTTSLSSLGQYKSAVRELEIALSRNPSDQSLKSIYNTLKSNLLISQSKDLFESLKYKVQKSGNQSLEEDFKPIAAKIDQSLQISPKSKIANEFKQEVNAFIAVNKPGAAIPTIRIEAIKTNEIYSSMYKVYHNKPIISVTVNNSTNRPIEDLKILLNMADYMDYKTYGSTIKLLKPGQSGKLTSTGNFNGNILTLEEDTPVSFQVNVEYTYNKLPAVIEKSGSMFIRNRNAMTWSNPLKLGAFVTYKDIVVKSYARAVAEQMRKVKYPYLHGNIVKAMAIYESLSAYGISYVKDPKTPFNEYSKKDSAIDYVQYPRDVLRFKSGDCDDLTVLYASLLENLGISTGMLLVPGHIFLAFDSGLPPARISEISSSQKLAFVAEGRVWIPVEITQIGKPFYKAWRQGAKQVQKQIDTDDFTFYTLQFAWREYTPVTLPPASPDMKIPSNKAYMSTFKKSIDFIIENEYDRKKVNEADLKTWKQLNEQGILRSRFGKAEEAMKLFMLGVERFPKKKTTFLINTGNVYYIKGNYKEALNYYQQAEKANENNDRLKINIAKIFYEIGDLENAHLYFKKAIKGSPSLERHYAYLSGQTTTRASNKDSFFDGFWDQ